MRSPRLYPHSLDMEKGAALVFEADQDFYRNAIFLDQRVLTEGTKGAWVPLQVLWDQVRAGQGGRVAPANFIFHTGHCGSTLISRLLDEVPSVLGLREPLALRTLAVGHNVRETLPGGAYEDTFSLTYQLLSRRFSPEQQVIIKATSMCNNLGSLLLSKNSANRGLLLFVTLEIYLTNMLDKKETPDIEGFFKHRLAGLEKRVPELEINFAEMTKPEKIAFSWLAEAAELADLAGGREKQQVLLMDFDQFLKEREIHLELIFNHFNLPGEEEALARMQASPVFNDYAKQPGFAFNAENRVAILKESRAANKEAIDKGIAFVEGLMKTHTSLASISEKLPLI